MNTLLRKIYKIAFVMALVLCTASVAFAATPDENVNDLENKSGYISVKQIQDNPTRYKEIPSFSDDERTFIDVDSINVLRNDQLFRVLNVKFVKINYGDLPGVIINNVIYKYDLLKPKTIQFKLLNASLYSYDGKFEETDPRSDSMILLETKSKGYFQGNIVYRTAFDAVYDMDWYNQFYAGLNQEQQNATNPQNTPNMVPMQNMANVPQNQSVAPTQNKPLVLNYQYNPAYRNY